jgi:hypothetical protein
MKKQISLLLAAVLFTLSLSAQNKYTVIGKLENGKPVLTADAGALLKTYNANLLKLGGIDAKFTSVTIKAMDADGMYALVFTGEKYKSSFAVAADSASLKAAGTTSCTTADCAGDATACMVKMDGEMVTCTPCADKAGCTKTTSTVSMLE